MKSRYERYMSFLTKEGVGVIASVLLCAEALLIILSWILSTTMTEGIRSLLSSEGIRWFFGSFTSVIASPMLVWLLLALIAIGSLQKSGLTTWQRNYRDRLALRVATVSLLIYLGLIALLTFPPHAILLSATGNLFPSAFSRSLVPIIAFGICVFSITYGVVSGRLKSLSSIIHAMSFGIERGAVLFVLYILLIQFYESLRFVFG
ncbi:aminobenzoyl-glutamate transport protein [Prevotella aff. ruminicola Tc2-24]|uniref:Aminobenzoyl-glutamate transport protein n=1 Tax=Prevotella aff. ruminicola Tc2-24 TaxID=81582 RepID=A0A1I0M3K0_9BACT|nr:AbgT family transporter [Prevotella aff. ruminicola Tc2-24]SEV82306.1 aminobenzoyl-glutamate transport protein [Prevotella aff. ruminicola Tc2-24]